MDTFDAELLPVSPDPSETGSLFISLACITLMSTLFGRKTAGSNAIPTSISALKRMNYVRGLVVGLYLVSWLFSLVGAMCVQTNNHNLVSCRLTIFACILLYASSKVLIYLFLIERVHIVTAVGFTKRWHSNMFRFNIALLSPYFVIFVLAIYYRVAVITDEGQCRIGLKTPAAIPLIAYDIIMSSWLTALFLRALISSTSILQGPTKTKLRDVAWRTLVGSIIALFLSCANIAILVHYRGHQRGLFCMASCTLDVTLNAITIHWVTSRTATSNPISEANAAVAAAAAALNGDHQLSRIGRNSFNNMQPHVFKDVGHLESHISVSIESYVEEYHQLHLGTKRPCS